ncbi:MAG: tetratricopeptide repeat protein [Saprospirales bacterium]|nr:tetratricopeptide repeat protein [Saprospirales bacterium]
MITAGLFAIHTLQVESVAWMAGSMKVGSYALFSLASMLVYLHYLDKRKWSQLALSLGLFSLACMCKEQAVVLPVLLLGIDYVKRRNLLSKEVILEKVPFFIVALIFGLVTMNVADEMRGTDQALPYTILERTLFASYALTAYTLKHILPVDLSTYYIYPPLGNTPAFYYLTPFLFLAMLVGFFYAWKKDQRLIVFGLAFFLVNVVLTILSQIFSVRDVMMADRYIYLSTIGFFLILAWWATQLVDKKPANRTLVYGGLLVYGLVLTAMTYQRCGVWKNSITVFTDAIEKGKPKEGGKYSPALALPFTNRGLAKKIQGDTEGAMADYNQAIIANPGHAKAYLNRGNIYFNAGQHDLAIENHNKTIELDPGNQKAYSSRGAAFASIGQYDLALADFDKAIEMDPNFSGCPSK